MKKLGIKPSVMVFLDSSTKQPTLLTKEDIKVGHVLCFGDKKQKREKNMLLINQAIKQTRTDYNFWNIILKQFFKEQNFAFESPEEFYFTKEIFKHKNDVDSGEFDPT